MPNIKKGIYKHYKGNLYRVIEFGFHSDTLEKYVVYEGQYDSKEFGNKPIWVRPLKEFSEKVVVDGKEVPRFELIKED